ncbi:MAG TPA: ABC transporter transmembrane domain-containing protein, partial [Anaerolineales bacterium]|nr:ABC transporter transmembrane domain-containing protein [Anaerolineales bacterium]
MSNQNSPRSNIQTMRAAMGRGPMQPGRIEKAGDPNRALIRLTQYLSSYKFTLIVVLIFVLAYISLGLLEPYLIGRAIDQYIFVKKLDGLSQLALLLLGAYLLDNAFQAASSWLMARISQDALRRLRRDLFEHLQKLSIAFFDRHTAGELMSRLTNDIDAINQAVSQNVVSLVASVLSLVGIVITMFVLNPWLAIAALLVVPIMFWFTNFIARYTRRGFRDLQKEL